MNLHEYQAKEILKRAGLAIPPAVVLHKESGDSRQLEWQTVWSQAQKELSGKLVVKAQIHAGGRGKGKIFDGPHPKNAALVLEGGVQIIAGDSNSSAGGTQRNEKVRNVVETMLGNFLQTVQTGPNTPKQINHVYVEQATDIEREFYMSFFLDGSKATVMYSRAGGVNIEDVAKNEPEKIHFTVMNLYTGLADFQCREILFALGCPVSHKENIALLKRLALVFLEQDCALLEINPLVLERLTGNLIALDCKFSLDSNAGYRHPEIVAMRDWEEEDPLEVQASHSKLNYVKLEGSVGCMVNGAGLAMATMDFVKPLGGEPANFLDVGGGANSETVSKAFQILNLDPNVRIIFINIFGGIVQCDRVANGILAAMEKTKPRYPLVVRLQGTHANEARKIFAEKKKEIPVECGVVQELKEAAEILQEFFRRDQ